MIRERIRLWIGEQGQALPAMLRDHRYMLLFKRAAAAEDEVYVGLADASDVIQARRILTKTYGDTLYQPIGAPTITVQSGDANVDTAVTTLDFGSPNFSVTSSPSGEANVELFYRPAHRWIYKETYPQENSTNWLTAGMGAPTVSANSTSNTDNATGPQIQLTTAATNGSVASIAYGNGGSPQPQWDTDSEWIVAAAATITSVRLWIGAFDGTVSSSDDPAVNGWGFRYSTAASDTTWKAWSNDGTSGGTITDTGVTVVSTSTKRFRAIISGNGTQILYYIDDVLVATHTTNLPTATAYCQHFVAATALSASARAIRVGKLAITHDR